MVFLISLALAQPIKVGVDNSYPYSYQDKGEWSGLSVELWEEVARRNHWETDYQIVSTADRFEAISTGTIDVYLPAVTITSEREKLFDFSHAYYKDYLAVTTHQEAGFWSYVSSFLFKMASVLGIVIPVLLTVAYLYMLCEKDNEKRLTWKEMPRALFNSSYWAMTTAATVGYGDESPKTIPGRILSMIWMLFGIMFFSWIITQLNIETKTTIDSKDIPNGLIVVENTTAEEYLKSYHKEYKTVWTEAELQTEFKNGKDVFYDQSLLQSITSDTVLRVEEAPQYYGLLFPEDSPYLELANRQLLFVLETPKWNAIRSTYLKD